MLRTSGWSAAVLAFAIGCGGGDEPSIELDSGVEPDATTADGAVLPDFPALRGTPTAPERLDFRGGGDLTTATMVGDDVFVGTTHGLYIGSAPDFDLRLATNLGDAPTRNIAALATFGGEVFVVTSVNPAGAMTFAGAYRSADAGATWTEASVPELESLWGNIQFDADASRLVLIAGRTVFEWNANSERFVTVSAVVRESAAVEGEDDFGELGAERVAVDGNRLVVDSQAYPALGVFELDLTDLARGWRLVDGLDDWGYAAFAFEADRGIATNASQVFVRSAEGWAVSLGTEGEEVQEPGVDALVRDGVMLAAGADVLRRSIDGTTWTVVSEVGSSSDEALRQVGERTLWVANMLRVSSDFGASWTEHASNIALADPLLVGAGRIFAGADGAMSNDASVVALPGAASFGSSAATSEVVCRAVTSIGCTNARTGEFVFAETPRAVSQSPQLFAAADTLFVAAAGSVFDREDELSRSRPVQVCELMRASVEGGGRVTWTFADTGLPNEDDCRAATTALVGAAGVIFAATPSSGTYRSDDLGDSWTPVEGSEAVVSAAACGERIVVRLGDGTLAASDDGGRSFAALDIGASSDHVRDLASLGGRCVVGLTRFDGSPTLLSSNDGRTFAPLFESFTEAVRDLSSDDDVLAVSTYNRGLFRIALDE